MSRGCFAFVMGGRGYKFTRGSITSRLSDAGAALVR
jgi:hypothetical protein